MESIQRPKISLSTFEHAIDKADLTSLELDIIEYIRFVGTFNQPMVTRALNISSKPPIISILSDSCRKIGEHVPTHFEAVRSWSARVSVDGVRWDGDLICSCTFNIDGIRLCPEFETTQFHNFAVHQEFFTGL